MASQPCDLFTVKAFQGEKQRPASCVSTPRSTAQLGSISSAGHISPGSHATSRMTLSSGNCHPAGGMENVLVAPVSFVLLLVVQ